MKKVLLWLAIGLVFSACAGPPPAIVEATPEVCQPQPMTAPTLPAIIPPAFGLDGATGLHVTGKPQVIDPASYQLWIHGKVDRELHLTYDDLRCMPTVTSSPKLICPSTFIDTAEWTGVPLAYVLNMAGVQTGASEILMTGADGYDATITLESAMREDSYLAYLLEGKPLPALHGFPLRAVISNEYGSYWVKWLIEIEVM